MPTIQLNNTIASTGNSNVLSGNTFEFLPYDCSVAMGFTQSATGLTLDILVGSDIESTQFVPLIKATAPLIPDDMSIVFEAYEGTRLTIRATNASGGNLTLLTTIKIDPVDL